MVITNDDIAAAKQVWLTEKDGGALAESVAISWRFYENLLKGQSLQIAAEFHRKSKAPADPAGAELTD